MKDSYLLLKNDNVGFLMEVTPNFLKVGIFSNVKSAFNYPCDSSLIDFYRVDRSKWKTMIVDQSDCVAKCFSLEKNKDFYLISLI